MRKIFFLITIPCVASFVLRHVHDSYSPKSFSRKYISHNPFISAPSNPLKLHEINRSWVRNGSAKTFQTTSSNEPKTVAAIRRWLEHVVIGMELCPWASAALQSGAVRIHLSPAETEEALLDEVRSELRTLAETEGDATTLVVTDKILCDFFDYNEFIQRVDRVIDREGLRGDVQLASFHPDYLFGDTDPDAAENWTNRAPYPVLHLLQEKEITKAVESYKDTEQVWQRNIRRMDKIGADYMRALVAWCVDGAGPPPSPPK